MAPEDFTQWAEIVVFVATAVWAVSSIRTTTVKLSTSMDHLSNAMKRLDFRVESVSRDLLNLRDRMTVIETRLDPSNGIIIKGNREGE